MKTLTGFTFLGASSVALAHPGHGLPGWIHPHAADYALLALAIAWAIAGLVVGVKKLRGQK